MKKKGILQLVFFTLAQLLVLSAVAHKMLELLKK